MRHACNTGIDKDKASTTTRGGDILPLVWASIVCLWVPIVCVVWATVQNHTLEVLIIDEIVRPRRSRPPWPAWR